MKTPEMNTQRSASGFTLVEMLVSVAVLTIVIVGTFNVFVQSIRSYNETSLMRNAAVRASVALDRMVIGVGTNNGLREAVAGSVVLTYPNGTDWKLAYTNNLYFTYTASTKSITDQSGKTICTNVISSTATNPTGGCQISVSVAESGGGRTLTNTMTTFVQFRN
jgi:prepilin-type N-terminal cleavage/methylation domain-containing protein